MQNIMKLSKMLGGEANEDQFVKVSTKVLPKTKPVIKFDTYNDDDDDEYDGQQRLNKDDMLMRDLADN